MKLISFTGQAVMLVIILAGLSFQLDLVSVKSKLSFTVLVVLVSAFVALVGTVGLIRRYRQNKRLSPEMVVLMSVCMLPLILFFVAIGPKGLSTPDLHDISTDTENPPMLAYAEVSRTHYDSPTLYRQDLVAQQVAAYPDIKTFHVALPKRDVFHMSAYAASMLGWRVYNLNSRLGQIDLRDTTAFFAFKADISIRVTAVGDDNSIIDVRSASVKLGRDFGFNARRIRDFFAGFNAELEKRQTL